MEGHRYKQVESSPGWGTGNLCTWELGSRIRHEDTIRRHCYSHHLIYAVQTCTPAQDPRESEMDSRSQCGSRGIQEGTLHVERSRKTTGRTSAPVGTKKSISHCEKSPAHTSSCRATSNPTADQRSLWKRPQALPSTNKEAEGQRTRHCLPAYRWPYSNWGNRDTRKLG